MADNLKQEVKEFKDKNGNNNIESNDMLIYLVSRVDKIEMSIHDKMDTINFNLNNRIDSFLNQFTPKKMFIYGFSILFTLLGALTWFIIVYILPKIHIY